MRFDSIHDSSKNYLILIRFMIKIRMIYKSGVQPVRRVRLGTEARNWTRFGVIQNDIATIVARDVLVVCRFAE